MGDIQTRPFSKNYSGLINQSVIALGITILCISSQEFMKRKRRGGNVMSGLGSRESWEFGYLYQSRSWAKNPSPPSPRGPPLSWVKQILSLTEEEMLRLRSVDATLYIRFLRGCFWFTLLHTLTTFPILFPIHVEFSEDTVSPKSMTRASISSLVATAKGRSLLWIHICLLFWMTLSWMGVLLWICNGAFNLRQSSLQLLSRRTSETSDPQYYPHPHPQYGFADIQVADDNHPNKGLRLRTVMVSNVPLSLRNEKELKEYFEYYMSRKLKKPSIGITSSTQPSFLNKSFAFVLNRAKRLPTHVPPIPLVPHSAEDTGENKNASNPSDSQNNDFPMIERVIIARKMTELASLLERREEILRLLETAHINLAKRTILAVKEAMDRRHARLPIASRNTRAAEVARKRRSIAVDSERGEIKETQLDDDVRMDQLIEILGPFVEEFGLRTSVGLRSKKALSATSKYAFKRLRQSPEIDNQASYPPTHPTMQKSSSNKTIWEALHSIPRSSLDAYQPLISLSHLFRGKTVPSIDYYTAKLNLLTSLITESRSRSVTDYEPVSTAFVTFANPSDARRACRYLAVHPNNPLTCLVTMVPMYQDLDWIRVMKSSFNVEFVKDWVVNLGVWGFTLFWLFPVSLLVGLVSIQNISLFWPSLKAYLDRHQWEEELIQSFLPTLLVSLLALLIPLILLLIAKKVHTFTTLSAMHDVILTRYYKFLIVNVLVFFCVGTATLQSILLSFKPSATGPGVLQIVADSFPTAGPFYVGWLIFTTAVHGGFEIALLGLPLIMYPATSRQVTPRKRAVGIRPRTFNFYYWLPSHLLVMHILLLFSVLNPFVLPFGTLYYFIEIAIIKHQLIYVYAKNYEGNGKMILIRIVRYSLDGLILAQAVFMAYMIVLKKSVNVGLAAFLIVFTAVIKLLMTRMCRAQFEKDDIDEADILCPTKSDNDRDVELEDDQKDLDDSNRIALINPDVKHHHTSSVLTWRLPEWVKFSYSNNRHRPLHPRYRRPNPFRRQEQDLSRPDPIPNEPERVKPQMAAESPNHLFDESPWGGAPLTREPGIPFGLAHTSALVDKHPPQIPWDDETTVDLPYDNPFYARPFDTALWLPRNPFGILDLDDTFDLKASLCVDASIGKLGPWVEFQETSSPVFKDSKFRLPGHTDIETAPVDGTEEIDLPSAITRRVHSNESSVEQTDKPMRSISSQRKFSETTTSTTSSILRSSRPPFLAEGSQLDRGSSRSRSSVTPQASPSQANRPSTPPVHEVMASSPHVAKSSSILIPAHPTNISARQAIFNEVLTEERVALIDRAEAEEKEATQSSFGKSWLTSWMFSKRN